MVVPEPSSPTNCCECKPCKFGLQLGAEKPPFCLKDGKVNYKNETKYKNVWPLFLSTLKASYNRIVREKIFSYFPCLNSVSLNVIDKWRGQLVITVVFLWCDRRNVRGVASVLLQNIILERSNNSPFLLEQTLTNLYSVLRPSFPLPAIDSVLPPLLTCDQAFFLNTGKGSMIAGYSAPRFLHLRIYLCQ